MGVEIFLFFCVACSGYLIQSENWKFVIRIICIAVMYGIYYKWFRISQKNRGMRIKRGNYHPYSRFS